MYFHFQFPGRDFSRQVLDCIGENYPQVKCESITISQLHNLQESAIIETSKIVIPKTVRYNIRGDCYTVDTLVKTLNDHFSSCIFEVDKASILNDYEADVIIKKSDDAKLKHTDIVLTLQNSLAYTCGVITYSAALQAGLDKTTDIPVVIDSKYQKPYLKVSLLKSLHSIQIASNFMLDSNKDIAYLQFTNEDLIHIFQDKLTILAKNLDNNYIRLNSLGKNRPIFSIQNLQSAPKKAKVQLHPPTFGVINFNTTNLCLNFYIQIAHNFHAPHTLMGVFYTLH